MHKPYIISILLMITAFLTAMLIEKRGVPIVVSSNLESIPMQIGAYQGTEERFPDSVYEALNADLHLYRHYFNPDGTLIYLYIGYYGTAKGGRTGHNPYACLPSAGWGIVEAEKVKLANRDGEAIVNAILARKGDVYETVLHWYQTDKDKILSTGIQQNIQRFLGRLKHNRNDGAFVQLSMITGYDGLEQASKDLKLFAEKIIAILPGYWPEEK